MTEIFGDAKHPAPVYMDSFGKHWHFVAQFNDEFNDGTNENEENEQKLRDFFLEKYLYAQRKGANIINLACKTTWLSAAKRGTRSRCPFLGKFVKATRALYTTGEHNHPLVAKGDRLYSFVAGC